MFIPRLSTAHCVFGRIWQLLLPWQQFYDFSVCSLWVFFNPNALHSLPWHIISHRLIRLGQEIIKCPPVVHPSVRPWVRSSHFIKVSISQPFIEILWSNFQNIFTLIKRCFGIILALFKKTRWPLQPLLCWKMPFFNRQLVLLRCKLNLFVIDMLDSYIHLLYTCEHVTLCVFTQGLPWGINVS